MINPGDLVEIRFAEPRPQGDFFLRWEGFRGTVISLTDYPEIRAYIRPHEDRPDKFERNEFYWPVQDLVKLGRIEMNNEDNLTKSDIPADNPQPFIPFDNYSETELRIIALQAASQSVSGNISATDSVLLRADSFFKWLKKDKK